MTKRTTITDIARQLGLSPKAVSFGLNGTGRLAPETRQKILETARQLNYTPNALARSLVTRRSFLIGVLLPYLNISFFNRVIAGIEKIATQENFSIILGNSNGDFQVEKNTIERFLQRQVDGIILYARPELCQCYELLAESGIPVLQVLSQLPGVGSGYIVVDNYHASYLAVAHLKERGYHRIGMLTHNRSSYELNQRYFGFLEALRSLNLPFRGEWCVECEFDLADAAEKTERLLVAHPEINALFAASDAAALGAVKAALTCRRKVPQSLAVVGFDDLEMAANQLVYPLTTMAQPKEELGIMAAEMLFQLINRKKIKSKVLDVSLVVRKTT